MSRLRDITKPHVLELYRWAVQDPETHAVLFRLIYERLRPGRTPLVLREDFAGTAADSVAWVAIKSGRRAQAVDIDGPTLAWSRHRAERILGKRSCAIAFVEGDLLSGVPMRLSAADIAVALNYSIMYVQDRASMVRYLGSVLSGLDEQGVFICNLFGGTDARRLGVVRHEVRPAPRLPTEMPIRPFVYEWEVCGVDEGSRVADCRIHFDLDPEGVRGSWSLIRDAFRYFFCLWSAEEVLSACREAGFRNAQVWRHTYDPSKGASGAYLGPVGPSALDEMRSWSVYVVAAR